MLLCLRLCLLPLGLSDILHLPALTGGLVAAQVIQQYSTVQYIQDITLQRQGHLRPGRGAETGLLQGLEAGHTLALLNPRGDHPVPIVRDPSTLPCH